MVAQRRRLPEQLGKRRAPHRDGFSRRAPHRNVEGLAVSTRIGSGPYAIDLRLQIRAGQ
jgi:hypothetical protein